MFFKGFLGLVALFQASLPISSASPVIRQTNTTSSSDGSEDIYITTGNDTSIHYSKVGSGPPLLFLHGFPDGSQMWKPFQVPFFQQNYTVITPDLRGYSPSGIPTRVSDYDMELIVADVKAIVDHENLDNVTLISHDFGGTAAWEFALEHTNRTRALIALNGDTPTSTDIFEYTEEQQHIAEYAVPYENYAPGQPKNISSLIQYYRNSTYAAEVASYLDGTDIFGMTYWYQQNYPRPPWGQPSPFIYHTVPALILWGEDDPFFSAQCLNNLARHYAQGVRVVTIPESGHWVMHDQHERVNKEIQSFLDFYGI